MVKQFPNPQSRGGDLVRFPKGENVQDDLAVIPSGYAQKLQNMEYRNGTLVRREPFEAYSTETLPDIMTDAIEYEDTGGTKRIIFGSEDGKIKEWTSASAHADRVTGLTVDKRAHFAQMIGACFHQNGENPPRRGDGTTWRVAGAPSKAGTLSLGALSAGVLDGTHVWMVTACIRESGTVILESDHSNEVSSSPSSEQQALSWVASGDARVNWYRLYRTKAGLGTPFYLVTEGNITSYTDNTADADLPEQIAEIAGLYGEMPVSKMIVNAGGRLACVGLVDSSDPNAGKAVHVSMIARDRFKMENYPADGRHKFYLPGSGDATAAFAYAVKDEDENSRDLFLAQKGACFILRGADPFGILEPVSFQVGVLGPKAVTQWGRFLFWVSRRGLEFLGPEGEPQLISGHVNAYFLGGGDLNFSANSGDQYINLEIHESRLLITLRDDSGVTWGNKALVLDLDRFNAYDPQAERTAFYTHWRGLGMAFFLPLSDGSLLLFDNANKRILKRGTGFQDYVDGTLTNINAQVWTNGMMAGFMTVLKKLVQVNVLQLSEADCQLDIEADYGKRDVVNKTVPRNITEEEWNKPWDKDWGSSSIFLSTLYVPRSLKGRFFQAKIKSNNSSSEFVFIGFQIFYSSVDARRLTKR